MIAPRRSFGFVADQEQIYATQRRPTPEEQVVIDAYREKYEETFGHITHGLHYIPFPGKDETVGVWIPLP